MSDEFSNNPNEAPEEDFFGEGETAVQLPDAGTVITLRTSSGDSRYVPATEPMTAQAVVTASGIYVSGATQFWLNGAQIATTDLVQPGSTLTLVGSVKGGTR